MCLLHYLISNKLIVFDFYWKQIVCRYANKTVEIHDPDLMFNSREAGFTLMNDRGNLITASSARE